MMVPTWFANSQHSPHMAVSRSVRTGPTRSGMNSKSSPMFPSMKKNPMRVTIFGASHSGRNSTHAFH